MAHVLLFTSAWEGLLNSSVLLAERLARQGHRVTFAGPPAVAPVVADARLPFVSIPASRVREFMERDLQRGWLQRAGSIQTRRREALEAMSLAEVEACVADLDPDLILVDGELHGHIVLLIDTRHRLVTLNQFASVWRRPGLPPPHHRVTPGVGWKGSPLGLRLLWLNLRLRKLRTEWAQRVRYLGCDRVSLLRELARRRGLALRQWAEPRDWLIPFTYPRLPALSLHALEFEFPHEPREGVHYVGPLVPRERPDSRVSASTQARLAELFRKRAELGGTMKLIYAGFGSVFSVRGDLVRRLVDAVASQEHWHLVMSSAGSGGDLPTQLPPNVHVYDWVPQLTVLQHADVAVTHGGIHTIDECVVHAVPMLIYCGRETDMAGNTERVVYHGLGVSGDPLRDDPGEIRGHIAGLLTSSQIANNLEAMRAHYRAYEADRVAETVVQSLMRP